MQGGTNGREGSPRPIDSEGFLRILLQREVDEVTRCPDFLEAAFRLFTHFVGSLWLSQASVILESGEPGSLVGTRRP